MKGVALHSIPTIRRIFEEVLIGGNKVTRIHTAWQFKNGPILLYEYVSCSHPSSSVCFFDSLAQYLEACEEVSWVTMKPMLSNEREERRECIGECLLWPNE